jgi:hypothetical protein
MAYQIAYFYALRADPDRGFDWLERAYRQHDGGLEWLKSDPVSRVRDTTRDTPRFCARLGFLSEGVSCTTASTFSFDARWPCRPSRVSALDPVLSSGCLKRAGKVAFVA